MIEIIGNRLYINGVLLCYAIHQIPTVINSHCYISFSHRHGRNLVNVGGTHWLGDNDGTLPLPDICIGSVIGLNGLLPDSEGMVKLTEYLQIKEDDGINVRIKVSK